MAGVNASLAPAIPHLLQLAEIDDNKVTPGLLGFVVFAALGTAVWFLMKSMNKQFKKVDFEVEPEPDAKARAAAGSGAETEADSTADAGR